MSENSNVYELFFELQKREYVIVNRLFKKLSMQSGKTISEIIKEIVLAKSDEIIRNAKRA